MNAQLQNRRSPSNSDSKEEAGGLDGSSNDLGSDKLARIFSHTMKPVKIVAPRLQRHCQHRNRYGVTAISEF
jgi:hypothetical protein